MKSILLNLTVLFCAMLFASELAGQGISYQAVARDGSGVLQANENINVRFYILEGSAGGAEVYKETHATTTNAYALFSVIIGKGTAETGVFEDIDWGGADHFLKVEVNGADMGTTQLETVPYSKVATAMNIDHLTDVSIGAVMVGDVLTWDGTSWVNSPAASSSPWTQTGTDVTYTDGSVGIGTSNPSDPFEVVDTSGTTGRTVTIVRNSTNNGNDVVEIRTESGAPDGGAFIEMQRGNTVESRINTDGSAEFLNVSVEENLDNTTAPAGGTVYANSLPIAYGYVSSGTSTASLVADFGVSSVSKPASTTGEYRLILDQTVVGQPIIIATSYSATPNDEIVTANRVSATEIEINIVDGSGNATNSNFYFVVFGQAQ